MKVKDLMTTNVAKVNTNSNISEIAQNMKNLNVGSIPVCDSSDNIVGIVTDRDIVLRNVASENQSNCTAQNVMSSHLVTVSPDTDIHEAANIMAKNQIRRLPVVENNKLVGMLSIGDLATKNIYVDEAGDALSSISNPSNTMK